MPLTDDVHVKRKVNRQAEASAARREQIMDAAVGAFTQNGFNGTSIREVANRAGMSHTGVLHHFPDKAALLEAVLDRRLEVGRSEVTIDNENGIALFRALIELARLDMQDPDGMRMYRILASEALAPTHPAHGYFLRWYTQVRQWIQVGLEDLQRRGLYAPTALPLDVAAAHIAGMRDGLDPLWLLDPGSIDLCGAVQAQLELYLTKPLDECEG